MPARLAIAEPIWKAIGTAKLAPGMCGSGRATKASIWAVNETIEAKIVEVVNDGEVHALTKRKATVPAELASFLRLPGVGP